MSVYLTAANKLRTVKITGVVDEAVNVKSFSFRDKLAAKAVPGQFVMIWIPGIDEIPMSLSTIHFKEGVAGITAAEVGYATQMLHKKKMGDMIGVRGPFGKGYSLVKAKNAMIVAGGTGIASLAPLIEKLTEQKERRVALLLGAKTQCELLFFNRMKKVFNSDSHRLVVTTEDGSYGVKGVITKPAEQLLAKEQFDMVYACGPELMMYRIFLMTERFKVAFQASLERLMRCAIGLCGTCVIGKYRVCQDGPVFSGEQLHEVRNEFGFFQRGFGGKRIPIQLS